MRIPVLLYHSVSHEGSGTFGRYVTSPDRFAEHLDLLVEEGFTSLRMTELAAALAGEAALPAKPVVITFDDGFGDFAEFAWPALETRGLAATLYVTTGVIGGSSTWLTAEGAGDRPMLTGGDLVDLDAAGCEIGAHTVTHPPLDCISRPAAQREIVGSRGALEDLLGHEVTTFAYPHGHHDATVRQLVVDAGFESAAAVKNASSHTGDDIFAIARFTIENDHRAESLRNMVEGRAVRVAPRRERVRTKAWRVVRRRRQRAAATRGATP